MLSKSAGEIARLDAVAGPMPAKTGAPKPAGPEMRKPEGPTVIVFESEPKAPHDAAIAPDPALTPYT